MRVAPAIVVARRSVELGLMDRKIKQSLLELSSIITEDQMVLSSPDSVSNVAWQNRLMSFLDRSANGLFDLIWHEDGSMSFRGNNGRFIGTKKSGHLFANCDRAEDNTKYFFYLINRPVLVLKCDQGFVGYKGNATKLECNKAAYETIRVERAEKGMVHLKGKV